MKNHSKNISGQLAEKGIQMANKLMKRNVSLLANQSNWGEMGVQGVINSASGVAKKWKFTCDEVGIKKNATTSWKHKLVLFIITSPEACRCYGQQFHFWEYILLKKENFCCIILVKAKMESTWSSIWSLEE